MRDKAVSGLMLVLLFVVALSSVLSFQPIGVEPVANASDETPGESTSSYPPALSPWWNFEWPYRVNHTISNASGAGTNYQVRFHLHWGSGVNLGEDLYFQEAAQSDFDDVRFLDDDHMTLLDYWVQEEGETANDTYCWVEIRDDLTASNVTIWIYWGNPLASSLSNGSDTFIDFDDYEYTDSLENHGWNITNIAAGGSLATQTAVASHGSYALKSYDPVPFSAGNGWIRYPTCPARVLWHWKVRKEETAGLYSCVWFDAKEGGNQFGQIQWQHLTYNVRARTESGSWVNFATYTPGQWHEVEVVVNTDTDKYESIWWDGSLEATNVPAYQASGNITHLHHNHAGSIGTGTAYEDFFYARKYVDPEPQLGSWGTPEEYDRAITVLSPKHKTYATKSIPLTFTVNETASWMGYSLDDQEIVTVVGNTTLTSLPEGLHNLVVYANNTVGRMWASGTVLFAVDTTPPTVSVLSPENKTYTSASVPLTFTVNESTSWMGYSLDDQANVTISGNTTLTGLTEGSNSVVVYANDTYGNMGASSEVTFTIAIPPVISIVSPENTSYAMNDVPLTFTVSEPVDWIGYSLDDQANVTITRNTTLTSLAEGQHGVVVYANDTVGNMGSNTVYLTVDTTPPAVMVLSPENITYDIPTDNVPLTFTLSEPTSWIGYNLDEQANVTITGNTTLTIMTEGPHSITVYANDTAGNTGVSNTVFFTGERLPCAVDISDAVAVFPGYRPFETTEVFPEWNLPINVTVNNEGTLPFNGTVNGYYSLDNATWLSMGSSQPISLSPSNGTLLVFYWDLRATGAGKSVYFMKFNATATSENLTATDEFLVKIKVRILGDADADNDVDVGDQRKLALTMFKSSPDPYYLEYNSFPLFTDMDGDGDVDVGDQRKQQINMFKTWHDP